MNMSSVTEYDDKISPLLTNPSSPQRTSPSKPEKRVREVPAAPAAGPKHVTAKELRLAERAKNAKKPWDDDYNVVKEPEWGKYEIYEEDQDDFSVVAPASNVIGEYDVDPELMRYKYNEAITEAYQDRQDLISRLNKRLRILDDVKAAYLRDIVTMRHVLDDVLTKNEREEVFCEWKLALPSVDLKGPLGLYSPPASAIQIKPCEACGGHVELQTNDMNMTVKLKKEIAYLRKQHEAIALDYAKLKTRYDNMEGVQNTVTSALEMEKNSLFVQLKEVQDKLVAKSEIAESLDISNKKHREENSRVKKENEDLVAEIAEATAHIEKLELENDTITTKVNRMEFEHHKAVTRMQEDKVNIDEQTKVISELELATNKLNVIVGELTEQNTSLEHDVVIGKGIIDEKVALLEREMARATKYAEEIVDLKQEVKDALYQNAVDQELAEQMISQKNGDQRLIEIQVSEMSKKVQNSAAEILEREKKIAELEDTIHERDKTITKLTTSMTLKKQELVAMQSFVSGGSPRSFAGDINMIQAMENAVANANSGAGGFFDSDGNVEESRGTSPLGPKGALAALSSGSFLNINTDFGPSSSRATSFDGTPMKSSKAPAPVSAPRPVTADTLFKPDFANLHPAEHAAVKEEMDALDMTVNLNVEEAVEEMMKKFIPSPAIGSTKSLMGSFSNPAGTKEMSPVGSPPGSSSGSRVGSIGGASPLTVGVAGGMSPAGGGNEVKHQLSNIIMNMIRKHDTIKTQQYVVAQKSSTPKQPIGVSEVSAGKPRSNRAGLETFSPMRGASFSHSPSFTLKSNMGALTEDGDEEEEEEDSKGIGAVAGRRGGVGSVPSLYGKAAFTLQESSTHVARQSTPTKRTKARPPPVGKDGSTSIAEAHPDASREEMILRESILSILTSHVGSINAKKAFNAIVPLISMYGSTLSACMDGFWQSLILVKRSSDFYNKCMIIFEKMVNTSKETSDQVGMVCAECVPLAMATMGEELSSWQTVVRLDPDIAEKLEGYINGQDESEMMMYTSYNEYFGRDDDLFLPKADLALSQLEKMTQYDNYCLMHLNNFLVEVLKDWSSSKAVAVDLDRIIEDTQEKAKMEIGCENDRLMSELSAVHLMLEQTKAVANEARGHEAAAQRELDSLRSAPQQILNLESKNLDLIDKIRDMKLDYEALEIKKEDLKNHNISLDNRITKLIQEKRAVEKESEKRRVLINELNADIKLKDQQIVNFTVEVKEMKRIEHERLYNLAVVACQTEPEVKTQANQTEFVCPTMSLRTAARINTASIKPTYPMVFSTTYTETATGGNDNASVGSMSSSASQTGGLTMSMASQSQSYASPSMYSSPQPTRSMNGVTGPYSGGINSHKVLSSVKKVGQNTNQIIGLNPTSEAGNLSTVQLVSKLNARFAQAASSSSSTVKKKKRKSPSNKAGQPLYSGSVSLGTLHSHDDHRIGETSGLEDFSDELNDEERRSVGGNDLDESDTASVTSMGSMGSAVSVASSISAITQSSLQSLARGNRGMEYGHPLLGSAMKQGGILAIPKQDGTAVLTTGINADVYHMGRSFLGVIDPAHAPLEPTTSTVGSLDFTNEQVSDSSPLDKFLQHHQRVAGVAGISSSASLNSNGSSKTAVPLNAAINMFRIGQSRTRQPSIVEKDVAGRGPAPIVHVPGTMDSNSPSRASSRAYSRERNYSDVSPTKPTLPPLSAYGLSVVNNK